MIYDLTVAARGQVFYENLGVLTFKAMPPAAKVGDAIHFTLFDRAIVLGRIVAIEGPGSSIRPDTTKEGYKIHWVPINQEQSDAILSTVRGCPCGCKAASVVLATRTIDGEKVRTRRCKRCDSQWQTREIYASLIHATNRKTRVQAGTDMRL